MDFGKGTTPIPQFFALQSHLNASDWACFKEAHCRHPIKRWLKGDAAPPYNNSMSGCRDVVQWKHGCFP